MARARRKEQSHVRRTNDYPIDPPGGRPYLIRGIEPDLWAQFAAACTANGRSWRWVLLSLMWKYAKGEVKL